jgi:hypothetical protein
LPFAQFFNVEGIMKSYPIILTVAQVAAALDTTPVHIRHLLRTGILPGFKKGLKVWGIFQEELDKWIEGRRNTSTKEAAK